MKIKGYLLKMFSFFKKNNILSTFKTFKHESLMKSVFKFSFEKPNIFVRPIIFSKENISLRVKPIKVPLKKTLNEFLLGKIYVARKKYNFVR